MKLQNMVAVITGGNSGIGLAAAREFAAEGARIAIFGRDKASLEAAVGSLGRDALSVQGDVRRIADLDRLFAETRERFDRVDVLVAGAGIAKFAPAENLSEDLFDEVADINFKGAFFTVQRALPHLRDGASVILLGSSGADSVGRPLTSIYNATKAAVRSLARSLSSELLPRRIRVNVLTPGMTETPIITRSGGLQGVTPDQIAAMITQVIPLKRRALPAEMAKAMLYLASNESAYMLGSELLVDGGLAQVISG